MKEIEEIRELLEKDKAGITSLQQLNDLKIK